MLYLTLSKSCRSHLRENVFFLDFRRSQLTGGDSVILAVTPEYASIETRSGTQRIEILQKLFAKGRLARIARAPY
jgi:hypothetical protein